MNLENELKLSYYKVLAPLSEEHRVYLVMDQRSKRVCVKKEMQVYNAQVFRLIKANPVKNMPQIFEVIEDAGRLITVEEYIQGITLKKYIEENGPMSEETAAHFALILCRTVQQLHSFKPAVIHRDIKPENIIINNESLYLLDLNAAKCAGTRAGQDTVLIGTPGFAAPEQYGFTPSDERTDIYAIGRVLNFMVTGKLPPEEKAKGRIGRIVQKCTQMEPGRRFKSAAEISAALSKKGGYAANRAAPPGFRSGKAAAMVFSAIGYILLIWFCLSLEIEAANTFSLWLSKILILLAALADIFLIGNYMDIQKSLGLGKIKNRLFRWMIIALICFFMFILAVVIVVIAEDIMT